MAPGAFATNAAQPAPSNLDGDMTRFIRCLPVCLLIAAVTWPLAASAADPAPSSRILVEVGWARPYGDLDGAFPAEESGLGFGVKDGLELGFRWRWHLSPSVSLSPSFHVVDYRDFRGTDEVAGDYRVAATSLRYALELMISQGDPDATLRPFLGVSAGWYRNRYKGWDKGLTEELDESYNTLGLALRGGVRVAPFELSLVYHTNRFSTWGLFGGGEPVDYSWDNLGLRAGWILPFE